MRSHFEQLHTQKYQCNFINAVMHFSDLRRINTAMKSILSFIAFLLTVCAKRTPGYKISKSPLISILHYYLV